MASGLLYLRYNEGKDETDNAGFHPWGDPRAAIIYSIVCAVLLIAAFVPPSAGSPFAKSTTGIEWYIVPTVGLSSLLLGYIYYLDFQHLVPRIKKNVLIVERKAVLVKEKGEWVQAVELVEATWVARPGLEDTPADWHDTNYDVKRVTVSMSN